MKILSIPTWLWGALALGLVAVGINHAVHSYLTMTEELAMAKRDINTLTVTNSNLAADNRALIKDIRDREKIKENIQKQSDESKVQFDNLDSKLQAAIVERDALEAAVAGTEVTVEAPANDPEVKNQPPAKPVVKPAPKKPVEISILWEAYCLDSPSPKCAQAK